MCTAITFKTKDFYFGRTLDYEHSFSQEVILTPRQFSLQYRALPDQKKHYAILGIGCIGDGYPLYFDAVNEAGLAMAGLNFVGNACYQEPVEGKENVTHFELIPWLLSQCDSLMMVKQKIKHLNITKEAFHPGYPASQLHWLIADRQGSITLEATQSGLHVYDNPVGVLTNNPPLPQQLMHLYNYRNLTVEPGENRFSADLELPAYSRGMGAMGLPGDFSSQSRFVRGAFLKANSIAPETEEGAVSQFFHIMDSVRVPAGAVRLEDGSLDITQYTSCCNADKGICYYTTYGNRQIRGIHMHRENLNTTRLLRWPMGEGQQVAWQNPVAKNS